MGCSLYNLYRFYLENISLREQICILQVQKTELLQAISILEKKTVEIPAAVIPAQSAYFYFIGSVALVLTVVVVLGFLRPGGSSGGDEAIAQLLEKNLNPYTATKNNV